MMMQVRIDFQRRRKTETFSRSHVWPMGNSIQLVLDISRQIHALRHVLAQAIGNLVGPALSEAVQIGKEYLD